MYRCKFCSARFQYEENIRSHADEYHPEIVDQILYRKYLQYLEYLENFQKSL